MRLTKNKYNTITKIEEVIVLLKQREEIEAKIYALDPKALINYEMAVLNID